MFLDRLPNYGQIAPFHLVLHLILKDQSNFVYWGKIDRNFRLLPNLSRLGLQNVLFAFALGIGVVVYLCQGGVAIVL